MVRNKREVSPVTIPATSERFSSRRNNNGLFDNGIDFHSSSCFIQAFEIGIKRLVYKRQS